VGLLSSALEGCTWSHVVLLERIADLSNTQARAPSRLPDWSVGHVLTHLARNADSVVRRLEGVLAGEIVDQYVGGYAGRAAEIAAGANRPAAEIVNDVAESATRMENMCRALAPRTWSRPTRDVSGAERPAETLLWTRWREVELHHVDLGLGYTVDEWPKALVAAWLPKELERLPARTNPNELLAWITGRAPAPALPPW
jgi:maleylpyruvate isomerase